MQTDAALRAQWWRVRLLAGAMARQIAAIPADASPASRRVRLGHVNRRASNFAWQFNGSSLQGAWWDAYKEARRTVWWVLERDNNAPLTLMFPIPD